MARRGKGGPGPVALAVGAALLLLGLARYGLRERRPAGEAETIPAAARAPFAQPAGRAERASGGSLPPVQADRVESRRGRAPAVPSPSN